MMSVNVKKHSVMVLGEGGGVAELSAGYVLSKAGLDGLTKPAH